MTDFYRAIADPTRRKILTLLSNKEHTQTELVQQFKMSQPAVKKHITILVEEGLVSEKREGRYCFYDLNKKVFHFQYRILQQEIGGILENKLDKLKAFVEEEKDGDGC